MLFRDFAIATSHPFIHFELRELFKFNPQNNFFSKKAQNYLPHKKVITCTKLNPTN